MPAPPVTIDRDPRRYHDVPPEEAAQLIAAGAAVLDVRASREHEELGHIPGAMLLPIELVAAAPAVLPEDGRAVVVVCEHGVRSRRAAVFLAEAGMAGVHNLAGGMSRWTGDRAAGTVAGLAYAFNAHTLVRFGHLQALHVQYLPLALVALDLLLKTPSARWALLLAGACVLQALTSNYLLVMTVIAMALRCVDRSTLEHVEVEPFDARNWERSGATLAHLSRT